jgi:hypothetical protein
MNPYEHTYRLDRFAKRPFCLAGALAATIVALTCAASAQDICFPTPVALPGLSGPPEWKAPGVVRTELNEPRWAAAPATGFANDPTQTEGLYRILVNDAFTELSVSFQAPTDPDVLSNADAIYFGFTTDSQTASLARGVRISLPASGSNPIDATSIQQYNYDAGAVPRWSTLLGAPSWLKKPSAWLRDTSASWGINFKVDLASVGLNVGNPFRIFLAMHKQNESSPSNSLNLSTPDPGATALLSGTLFIADPTKWEPAAAIDAGCPDGISIDGNQIGTRAVKMGNPAPTLIETTSGTTNRFYAEPTIPGTVGLFSGLFQATFHFSDWQSVDASNAPWVILPNGAAVSNGAPPAATSSILEFACLTNAGGQTCGLPTPTEPQQCVYVELRAAPGQSVRFTKAAAYRCFDLGASVEDAGVEAGVADASRDSSTVDAGGESSTGTDGSTGTDSSMGRDGSVADSSAGIDSSVGRDGSGGADSSADSDSATRPDGPTGADGTMGVDGATQVDASAIDGSEGVDGPVESEGPPGSDGSADVTTREAGADGRLDASTAASKDDSGCSCRTSTHGGGGWSALGLLCVVALARRRRVSSPRMKFVK